MMKRKGILCLLSACALLLAPAPVRASDLSDLLAGASAGASLDPADPGKDGREAEGRTQNSISVNSDEEPEETAADDTERQIRQKAHRRRADRDCRISCRIP